MATAVITPIFSDKKAYLQAFKISFQALESAGPRSGRGFRNEQQFITELVI
jgi:hypothetical protein